MRFDPRLVISGFAAALAGFGAGRFEGWEGSPTSDALRAEMSLLEETAREAVSAIVDDDLERLRHDLARARAAHGASLDAYRPPVRGEQRAGFDRSFAALQIELGRLDESAADGDTASAARQLGAVLEQCVACHQRFRVPPGAAARPAEPGEQPWNG